MRHACFGLPVIRLKLKTTYLSHSVLFDCSDLKKKIKLLSDT